jgi:hypothetical protein
MSYFLHVPTEDIKVTDKFSNTFQASTKVKDRERESPGKLELFLESNDIDTFQSCDNLTIAPWGDVIICEDKSDARIIGITPRRQDLCDCKKCRLSQIRICRSGFLTFRQDLICQYSVAGTNTWRSPAPGIAKRYRF